MLQVARLSSKVLGDSAALVEQFILRQQNTDGGFKDRAEQSDLYYTVFGLDGLIALVIPHPTSSPTGAPGHIIPVFERARRYLETFADGPGLDFVHLCCLARCWAAVSTFTQDRIDAANRRDLQSLLRRIESFRSKEGGYNPIAGAETGTAYASFLALSAYQDLKQQIAQPTGLVNCLTHLETADGAWTNEMPGQGSAIKGPQPKAGSTNATAAALTVLRQFGQPMRPGIAEWLLARAHPQGGFLAVPNAPAPDLLSTATALHALAGLQSSFEHLKENCLDFIDSLWTNEGAFFGHWHDDYLDCEYTFYALLSLGHLSF
jgi:prenyltransferase beta subunit